jgi:hypothetical protein
MYLIFVIVFVDADTEHRSRGTGHLGFLVSIDKPVVHKMVSPSRYNLSDTKPIYFL